MAYRNVFWGVTLASNLDLTLKTGLEPRDSLQRNPETCCNSVCLLMPEPAYLTAEPGVHPMVFAPNGSNEQQSGKPKELHQEEICLILITLLGLASLPCLVFFLDRYIKQPTFFKICGNNN